jgi:hypothetical protein
MAAVINISEEERDIGYYLRFFILLTTNQSVLQVISLRVTLIMTYVPTKPNFRENYVKGNYHLTVILL